MLTTFISDLKKVHGAGFHFLFSDPRTNEGRLYMYFKKPSRRRLVVLRREIELPQELIDPASHPNVTEKLYEMECHRLNSRKAAEYISFALKKISGMPKGIKVVLSSAGGENGPLVAPALVYLSSSSKAGKNFLQTLSDAFKLRKVKLVEADEQALKIIHDDIGLGFELVRDIKNMSADGNEFKFEYGEPRGLVPVNISWYRQYH